MGVTPTYPGVYVQEVPSGVRTIVGVSTSIAVFIGRAKQGPLNEPALCLNFSDFERVFSSAYAGSDLARAVRLFFMNGGSQCYVMRIAHNATKSYVKLKNENGSEVLKLTAKQAGLSGEQIRAAVTYSGQQPETTFNMEIFRWEMDAVGKKVKKDREEWKNLSMKSNSPKYAPDFITQNSKLVDAAPSNGTMPIPSNGFSQSGRPIPYDSDTPASLHSELKTLFGSDIIDTNKFKITVDGKGPVEVDLRSINFSNNSISSDDINDTVNAVQLAIKNKIENTFATKEIPGIIISVKLEEGPTPVAGGTAATKLMRISSTNNGDVYIQPASENDLAASLMLGTAQGGLEVSAYAALRPAPTGITFKASEPDFVKNLGSQAQNQFTKINFELATPIEFNQNPGTDNIYKNIYTTSSSPNGNNDGVRETLGLVRDKINEYAADHPQNFKWKAELWGYRLAILPDSDDENLLLSDVETIAYDIGTTATPSYTTNNVQYYSLGTGGTVGFQEPATSPASDGTSPDSTDYDNAYKIIDKEVELFNLMILPKDEYHIPSDTKNLWGPASNFCQKRRAFLLMDAPASWGTVQEATSPSNGVNTLRVGLVNDHSAIFYPRVTINENGLKKNVGASGAIAGLMARIDGTRGVWKAPAGTEANLRGIVGVEYKFSDDENGVLNPRAINTLRVFPNGIVNWGARTMDGDDDFGSEYKYIPVRRLALFMEESLYRGLKWVVFEPNDEPLWSQIRLNVGAFMHNLFRQGAFQGQTPKEAYFVKCDSETTTQNDINLGIVNIWVGFAPLKPAEFVILYLQQMAGQIET
jgi:phage tail sheath protein FI